MILPAVVMVLMISALMTGTLSSVAMLALRGTRQHEQRQVAQWEADEGLALAMQQWPSRQIAERTIGDSTSFVVQTALGKPVQVAITRTHPLVARLTARTDGGQAVTWVWLAPPRLSLSAPVTALGAYDSGTTMASAVATIDARVRRLGRSPDAPQRHRALYFGPATESPVSRIGGFAGLAVIDGMFPVDRMTHVRGLVIVYGEVQCAGGMMHVDGAVVIVSAQPSPHIPPPCLAAQMDPRAIEEALTFAAIPQRGPFHLRHWYADPGR